MKRLKKWSVRILISLAFLYIILLIPGFGKSKIVEAGKAPFAWNKDEQWKSLEDNFIKAKQKDSTALDSTIHFLFNKVEQQFGEIKYLVPGAKDKYLHNLLSDFFLLSSYVAVETQYKDSLINYYNKVRNEIKYQSRSWDLNDIKWRNFNYQMIYGMRAAVEEVLLQSDSVQFNPVIKVKEEMSVTPSADLLGITIHSGDLLVSRGGAEVSALISRGNDYPGNFSHVALAYVDDRTGKLSFIESHIEKGVAIATADQYIKDKKLRFMVLRPRADLPALVKDSMLPHKAAKLAYEEGIKRHVPYDFKMDFYDSTAMFCSEVGSYAYKKNGIQLWQGVSTISSQGVVNWLNAFGVENFVTQMPSDLEYDPQLSVVAEWRDPETLFKDHIDNAVMDALIEKADEGKKIDYNIWQLPVVRVLKGYCMLQNAFGKVGIIPEGMSATQALKNQYFVAMYQAVKKQTEKSVEAFIQRNKYRPPYWQLVNMAREAATDYFAKNDK